MDQENHVNESRSGIIPYEMNYTLVIGLKNSKRHANYYGKGFLKRKYRNTVKECVLWRARSFFF